MAKYRIRGDRSQVWIEARSSLQPIHGVGRGLEGFVEAAVNHGRLELNGDTLVRLELPVDNLKSGKAMEDAQLLRRIDARRFPTIRGVTTEFKEIYAGRYRVRGDLTFHGVTRAVEGEVSMSMPDGDKTIVLEGEQTFDIRDFGVQPPRILMLRVHPDVKVRVRIVAEQEA